ncbi:MAG: alpha-amylase family glycosyl hydrolase [Clostridium sp.]|nr:alpha-amylase family glycosyl hydrolase [Prevotella sp.]MCM1428726.1 alpha-amylase family glycosyl hydrolase [Clostridium sp.]MCM1475101.1 alpha-amylase family glycosyl hydrolase [Muribaculaceae bacterium]
MNTNLSDRLIIYQLFPRIFTNMTPRPVADGTLEQNGAGHLNDLSSNLLLSLKDMGVNCLWLTGVIEHATKSDFTAYGIPKDNPNVVKGEAGSPYAIKDYYDIDPAIAEDVPNRMFEFEQSVERIHNAGMKVIIDFVPNHTARRYHSDSAPKGVKDFGADDDTTLFFSLKNNYYYITNQQFSPDFDIAAPGTEPYVEFPAKATGNDCFTAFCSRNDWYETVKLNYGHDPGGQDIFNPTPDTWYKMLNILKFWASKGVDGFRCDMVFMVPLAFWHWAIPQVKALFQDIIFIGEIYDVSLYRPFLDYGCFDYLYDKVNLYDTLVGIERYNFSAARLTGCWQSVDGIGNKMLNFLENHDEVRYGSSEFAGNPGRVVPDLVVSALISSGPFMVYYGQELGERALDNEGFAGDNHRSTIFDYWSYDTLRRWYDAGKCSDAKLTVQERWLRDVYSKVLHLCNEVAAFRYGAFFDLMYVNLDNDMFSPHEQFAFLRYDDNEAYLIVANFSDKAAKVGVRIPEVAMKMAELQSGSQKSRDLLWNKLHSFSVEADERVVMEVGGRDAIILPIKKFLKKN